MKNIVSYVYLVISLVIFIIGFMGAVDPLIHSVKQGMDFLGRSVLSATFLVTGFYGLTRWLKDYLNL